MKTSISLLLLLSMFGSFAQKKEAFDLASYTIPAGWKNINTTKEVISYGITSKQKGTYCQVGIFASTISKGSLKADIENEWQELVVKTYKPTTKPTLVPTESENGWEAQGGTAPFEFNGSQSVVMLVTMSGYGKCMSIVIVTNTEAYQAQIENFLESVDLKKPEMVSLPVNAVVQQPNDVISKPAARGGFHFSNTNFDDGWVSTVREDWVEVTRNGIKVLIHYPNKHADAYNSVVMDGLKNAWNILVAPKYSTASNFEFKPISGWQTIEFGEADATEKTTGRGVHVVLLFRYRGKTQNLQCIFLMR
jgi:hypothetical protein